MSDLDCFIYMMANEKIVSLLCQIDMTMEFMRENKIEADEAVRKAMEPAIKSLQEWVK